MWGISAEQNSASPMAIARREILAPLRLGLKSMSTSFWDACSDLVHRYVWDTEDREWRTSDTSLRR